MTWPHHGCHPMTLQHDMTLSWMSPLDITAWHDLIMDVTPWHCSMTWPCHGCHPMTLQHDMTLWMSPLDITAWHDLVMDVTPMTLQHDMTIMDVTPWHYNLFPTITPLYKTEHHHSYISFSKSTQWRPKSDCPEELVLLTVQSLKLQAPWLKMSCDSQYMQKQKAHPSCSETWPADPRTIDTIDTRPRGYKTFLMHNSINAEIDKINGERYVMGVKVLWWEKTWHHCMMSIKTLGHAGKQVKKWWTVKI